MNTLLGQARPSASFGQRARNFGFVSIVFAIAALFVALGLGVILMYHAVDISAPAPSLTACVLMVLGMGAAASMLLTTSSNKFKLVASSLAIVIGLAVFANLLVLVYPPATVYRAQVVALISIPLLWAMSMATAPLSGSKRPAVATTGFIVTLVSVIGYLAFAGFDIRAWLWALVLFAIGYIVSFQFDVMAKDRHTFNNAVGCALLLTAECFIVFVVSLLL